MADAELLEAMSRAVLDGAREKLAEVVDLSKYDPIIVVNLAWEGVNGPVAIGTAVPSHSNSILGDSLRESASSADMAYQGTGC